MKENIRMPGYIFIALALLLALSGLSPAPGAQAASASSQPQAATVETYTSLVISNEAPGLLVDHLIALGHGGETLLQVLSYLKAQSGGVISDAFYNQVASSQPGSEVFTAKLNNYAGLDGGIEICGDGTVYIPSIQGSDYYGSAGYPTAFSLDHQFIFTYAQDAAHHIYTHSQNYGGGLTREYYAFAIAWKFEAVSSFILSNEAPGHLVDTLVAQGHGGETLLQVLGYLKSQSGGAIPDDFYNKVASAPPGSEVFTATLGNYAWLVGGIEIAADGTAFITNTEAAAYQFASGFATTPSQDGTFKFTTSQDLSYDIYTHTKRYEDGIGKDYYAFGIAWQDGAFKVYVPLVRR